jgi:hypothetical protein
MFPLMVVSGVVSVLATRSEIRVAPLGEPSPVDVFAVAPLEMLPIVPRPSPHPNVPQNELEPPFHPSIPPNGSNPPNEYPLEGELAGAGTLLKLLDVAL